MSLTTKSIVVLISGSGSNLQALIDAEKAGDLHGHITAVISNRADAYGLQRAEQAGIATEIINHKDYANREEYDQALAKAIDQHRTDLVVLAGFMRILTDKFVDHYQGRMLNIHPSLLPKYRGLNTHQRAIDDGELTHGVSVHFVTPELDGGPVIMQSAVDILPNDDASSLAERVQVQEHLIYPLVVQWFCQNRLKLLGHQVVFDDKVLKSALKFQSDQDG